MLKNYIDVYESHNLNNGLCHYRTFSFHWPSLPTIATQKHNAMKKLNLSNHSELIKYVQTVGKMEE